MCFSTLYQYRFKKHMSFRVCINTNSKNTRVFAFVSIQIEKHVCFFGLYQYRFENTSCFYLCIDTNGQLKCFYVTEVIHSLLLNFFSSVYHFNDTNIKENEDLINQKVKSCQVSNKKAKRREKDNVFLKKTSQFSHKTIEI